MKKILCIMCLLAVLVAPAMAANITFSDQTVSGTALPQKLILYDYAGTYLGEYNSTDTIEINTSAESYAIVIKANAVNYLASPENLFSSLREGVQTNIVWIVLLLGAALFVFGRR